MKKRGIRALTRDNRKNNFCSSKQSQITIFIIIAVIIIAVALLIFFFQDVKRVFVSTTPALQFKECIEDDFSKALEKISQRGGSINPQLGYMYSGTKVEYLCYTNQYYQTCSQQQPLLRQHIERELLEEIKPQARKCVESLKQNLKEKGYSVSSGKEDISISIVPDNIKIIINGLTAAKQQESVRYNKFEANFNSKIYSLIMLTSSILNWEARYGDSEITTYMAYYPNIRVEKLKQSDGTKIYKLQDRRTKDKFNFATRSLSWPAGYGVGETYKPIS